MNCSEIIKQLESLSSVKNKAGMARFGINTERAYGITIKDLRKLANRIKRNHVLAQQLWDSGMHEARILASMVDEPELVTEQQVECWASDFNSWDLVDQCCLNLFSKTKFAYSKCFDFSKRREEFIKRTAFALMACLAWQKNSMLDSKLEKFFPIIIRQSVDDRNFVKKAVNWALRQLGKRNRQLNKKAIAAARAIQKLNAPSAQWIAKDALRELTGDALKKRFSSKQEILNKRVIS